MSRRLFFSGHSAVHIKTKAYNKSSTNQTSGVWGRLKTDKDESGWDKNVKELNVGWSASGQAVRWNRCGTYLRHGNESRKTRELAGLCGSRN